MNTTIVCRLKEEMIVMEKDLRVYDIKVKDLRIRTNNDCKDIRQTLTKKYNLKKIRTAEIELLRQVWSFILLNLIKI